MSMLLYCRTEWIDSISRVSNELKGPDSSASQAAKSSPKEGATVAKQGIKVSVQRVWLVWAHMDLLTSYTDYGRL